jgi:vitamin B12 transporter
LAGYLFAFFIGLPCAFAIVFYLTKGKTYFLLIAVALSFPFLLKGQKNDTLPAVKVYGKSVADIAAAANNTQQLNKAAIASLGTLSVADAVKYFSGVTIKDYGGIGGLKTISVRSLGANHTAVLLDGLYVGDAQGGQIDLGRLSLENIETIQLFANSPSDILMPARSFASANVLSLSTSSAKTNEKLLSLKCKTGSFGYLHPSVVYKGSINKKIAHSFFAEYQYANGAYPFKDYETGTATVKRSNSDIKAAHAEYDIAFYISDSNTVKLKAFYYNSKRGLPGGIILFNSFSAQRLNNESFFAQGTWRKSVSVKTRFLLSTKYSYDYKYYIDPSYQNSAGKLENEFRQQEAFASAAISHQFTKNFSAAAASDFFYSKLNRTDSFAAGFANPSRNNFLQNFSVQYKNSRAEINGNILFTSITEKTKSGAAGKNFQKFTPAFAASVQPFANMPLRLRASYKHIFRAPTFDDLYYTNIGNTNLKPELVKQYNAGIALSLSPARVIEEMIVTVDAYYNTVTDKILAVPRMNLFQWTILNIGKADIKGIDLSALVKWKKVKDVEINSRFSYSYQKALDVSNPSSLIYKTQLPYTPEHSGSINLSINYRRFQFNYNTLLCSYRYRLGEQNAGNLVQGWATQDFSVVYQSNCKKTGNWQVMLELNNIFNQQYEVIKYYPMPRFNYRLGLSLKF